MAVTITPLGFKKPDGNELVRGGDNAIADNAELAQTLIATDRAAANSLASRVTNAEGTVTVHSSQIAGLSAQIGAVSTPFNIGVDLDGVPYFQDGASGLSLAADTDGTPYFL